MENKYKIRNYKKVKMERVGVVLTEKQVIDEFGLPVDTLIDSKIIEKVELKQDSDAEVQD